MLEEFSLDETVVLSRGSGGRLGQATISLPNSVKLKRYRQEFRTRFCEGLLARRILIAEGSTEATALPTVARRLSELRPDTYASLEALGICTVDAGGETNIPDLAKLYRQLGKQLFAVCDKQSAKNKADIEAQVEKLFMHEEANFEDLVLKNTPASALERFADTIDWPQHILNDYPHPKTQLQDSFRAYFGWSKGNWGIADFLAQCNEDEIPKWLGDTCASLKNLCDPAAVQVDNQDTVEEIPPEGATGGDDAD